MLAFLRAPEKDGKPQPSQIYLLRSDGGEPHALTSLSRADPAERRMRRKYRRNSS